MNDVIDIDAVAAIGAIGQPVRRKEDQRLLTGRAGSPTTSTCPAKPMRSWFDLRTRMRGS
jgi:hypothetical protein